MTIEKPASNITEADIRALVQGRVCENQRLDYKEMFPQRREEHDEFLRHVAGMANTTGGMILIGVAERRDEAGKTTGEPESICGIGECNLDNLVLRLTNAIRDSIAPRIVPPAEVVAVQTGEGTAVVIRVRRSLTKPHMFRHRFYARQGPQTVPLEVEQVRAEFLEGAALSRRIQDFRVDRLALEQA